jgi:hypothetical protein
MHSDKNIEPAVPTVPCVEPMLALTSADIKSLLVPTFYPLIMIYGGAISFRNIRLVVLWSRLSKSSCGPCVTVLHLASNVT